jgi:protein O-mannosyl-transferase
VSGRRLYLAVAAAATVCYLGALGNRFAWDDQFIILQNPIVHHLSGLWRAFGAPFWPAGFANTLYRPFTVATFAADWAVDGARWFHAVNLLWHALASVLVAVCLRRWVSDAAALVGGVLFAVHPVHVEAVATVVGRAELLAACFTVLAVYAALARQSVGWSTAAWVLGLLSKENAIVAPGLIMAAWLAGLGRPTRRRAATFGVAWVLVGGAYLALRWHVLHRFSDVTAAALLGQGPVAVRLTGVAELVDVVRLLLFPLKLRVDYSPAERTAVTTPLDPRFIAGLAVLAAWVLLTVRLWRRGRRFEAFGLLWIGIAYLPAANLLFPVGIVMADRTLYMPSMGLALAVGGWARGLRGRPLALAAGLIFALGGLRTALRVPTWRSSDTVLLSVLEDSPNSYVGPMGAAGSYLRQDEPEKALRALRIAARIFPQDGRLYLMAAHAEFKLGHPRAADSLLQLMDRYCVGCTHFYEMQAAGARALGDTAVADSLLAHAPRPPPGSR